MMEKNMLVLYGSPRERGFTKELLKIFIQEWENVYPNTNIYTFHAYQENMAPCTACGFCRQKEGCSIPDYQLFDTLYRNADVVVVATPVYGLSFPAPLKAVFDRTQQYYEAYVSRHIKYPFEKPKKAFLLSVYGSNDKRGVEMMQQQLQLTFSVMNTKLIGTVSAGNTDCKPLNTKELQNEVKRLLLANLSVL